MIKLVYGDEPYLIFEKIKEIIAEEKIEKYNIKKVNGEDKKFVVDDFIKSVKQIDLFSDKKLFLLKNPAFLKNKMEDKEYNQLSEYLNFVDESNVIIIYNENGFSFKSNLKIFKEISKKAEVFYYKKVNDYDYLEHVNKILKKKNINLNRQLFDLLVYLIPNDLLKLENEVEKLRIYGNELTKETIISLIDPNMDDNLFNIINAILDKNIKLVTEKINEFYLQNIYPSILISSISSQMRFMFCVKTLYEKHDKKEISDILNANPVRVSIALNTINKHKKYNFLNALKNLMELDQKIKIEYEIDSKDLFMIYIMKIIRGN